MTGITAKRNSVSDPKTAMSCGLTLSAAIRRVSLAAGGPSAAIPETVIIGDRGLTIHAVPFASSAASQVYTLLIFNPSKLRQDDPQRPHIQTEAKQTEDHS